MKRIVLVFLWLMVVVSTCACRNSINDSVLYSVANETEQIVDNIEEHKSKDSDGQGMRGGMGLVQISLMRLQKQILRKYQLK